MMPSEPRKTEIMCICSGKGGVGKTLLSACLGYALTRAGLRVLMIDGDLATDGLSLFLLGPKGSEQVDSFSPSNTFAGALASFHPAEDGERQIDYQVRKIYRNGPDDHGLIYDALISGRSLYGDFIGSSVSPVVSPDRENFQAAAQALFDAIRRSGEYDYVLVDTRGGFSFESTDLCALADSFLGVIEADITSFYQTRNLVRRIDEAAGALGTKSVLRGFLVNKAVDGMPASGDLDLSKVEVSFRNALTREFPIKFSDTHPVPADLEVLQSYKMQMAPFLKAPASYFTYAALTAFSDIFQVVTSRWSASQVQGWQDLVNSVAMAIRDKNEQARSAYEHEQNEKAEVAKMREALSQSTVQLRERDGRIERLEGELKLAHAQIESELKRSAAVETLVRSVTSSPPPPQTPNGPGVSTRAIPVPAPLDQKNQSAPPPASRPITSPYSPQTAEPPSVAPPSETWEAGRASAYAAGSSASYPWGPHGPQTTPSPYALTPPRLKIRLRLAWVAGFLALLVAIALVVLFVRQRRTVAPPAASNAPAAANAPAGSYNDGAANRPNQSSPVPYLQKECDSGDMLSCAALAVYYKNGEGVPQDYSRARSLFQKACDGGDALACQSLGVMYLEGRGMPKEPAKGKQWLQKACSMGSSGACTELRTVP
jgi:MinD-like ATPase involved in chromosome partitioning or flagellar assembly